MIHMNGRVQDPVLGRFLSPDPIVQAPYYSQSLNRYSYVWNNPLSLTDPSGFQTRDPFDPTDLANCYAFPGACDSLDRYRQLEEWYNTTQYLLSLSRIGERGASEYRPGGPVTAEQICKGSCHGVDYSSHRYETDAERQQLYIIAGSAIVTAGTYGVVELVALTLGARYAAATTLLIEATSGEAPVPAGIGSLARGARAVPNGAVDDVATFGANSVGAAQRVPRVLQTGGQTINQRTADALNVYAGSNLSRRDVGRALEALKREMGLPNRLQGSRILDNGDLVDDAGKVLGNIIDYFP
jgi:hypothetical protein